MSKVTILSTTYYTQSKQSIKYLCLKRINIRKKTLRGAGFGKGWASKAVL